MDALPEGFEPVGPPPAQNAPASPAAAQSALPEGFEPVPSDQLRTISPSPPSFLDRLRHGQQLSDEFKQMLAKPYSERLKEWTAGQLNAVADHPVLSSAGVAVGTLGAAAAGILESPFDFAGYVHRAMTQGLTPQEETAAGVTGAMLAGGLGAGAPTRSLSPLFEAGNGELARIAVGLDGKPTTRVVGEFPPKPIDFDTAAAAVTQPATNGIQAAALRSKEGRIFTGATHGDAGIELQKAGHTWDNEAPDGGSGFVTKAGKFVDRDEALRIAQQADQHKYPELVGPDSTLHARDVDFARVKQKLLDAWENEGKHPAEVAAEAESDAMVRHDLSSAAAHPTDMPPPVSPDVQPVSIPGKILSDLGAAKDRAFDAARWVEKNLTPISTSPDYAIRYATEYLSSLRRVQWDWTRYDQMLMEKFNPEQRAAMFRAMDEESVMAQSGERSEHMGLATLAPEERAAVSELSQHAIATRIQMLDKGMVTTEGLPHYVPRLFKGKGTGEPISMGPEARIRERTGSMNERKYLTAEESEAAAKERFGPQTELVRDIRTLPLVLAKQQRAIAAHDFIEGVRQFGRDIGDPQIVEGEKPTAGKWITLPDSDLADWYFRSNGETTFATKQPMHIKGEWEGAIKAIQDTKFNNFDKFIAEVKNRPMSLIMNSPFIHASVVYSKALPSNPGNMITFRFMRQGNQLLSDPAFMKDMIDGGMVLWGRRPTLYQDVSGLMEGPQLEPGRSLTSRVLAYIPGLFDEAAGAAVKRGVDKVGEIVHDKILAESVQKLQASLAYDFRETMRKKFPDVPDDALNVLAAHEANRFGGSLPPEAMSSFSRGFANAIMFSRQFTLGNLGILKDAAKGPPEYVMGRIRDMLGPEGADQATALKSQMQRHAFAVVMLDLAMYYGMNSLFQSAVNVASGTPLADEAAGYWWRINQAVNRVQDRPTSVSSYLSFLPSMSPTFYHEPGKEGKILLGLRSDGTAIYGRSVIGRMGEDYTGLLINPAVYALTKMAPLPRAFMEVLGNKDGFDRPIYDPKALKAGDIGQAWNIAKHFIEAELPMQQIKGATNLIEGQGDYKDAISTFGPYMVPPFTVTASQGYPGGPIAGAVAGHQRDQRVAQDLAMSGVKDMVVKKNDLSGARQTMSDLGVKPGLQNFLIRNWQNPGMAKTSSRALAEFYQHASPVEIEILNSMRNGGQ